MTKCSRLPNGVLDGETSFVGEGDWVGIGRILGGKTTLRKTVPGKRTKHLTEPVSLADLYDPLTMPSALLKAHQKLDAAVDKDYEANGYCKAQATSKIGGLSRGLNPLAPPFSKWGTSQKTSQKK